MRVTGNTGTSHKPEAMLPGEVMRVRGRQCPRGGWDGGADALVIDEMGERRGKKQTGKGLQDLAYGAVGWRGCSLNSVPRRTRVTG